MPLFHRKPHEDPAFKAAFADVDALVQRLAHDVMTLDDGGDPKNRQALADASERYNTAGAQLGEAHDLGALQVVRAIALEGLHATRVVRTRMGLDPGPDPAAVPMAPPAPPQPPAYGQPGPYGQPGGYPPYPQQGPRPRSGLGGLLAGGLAGLVGGEILGDMLGGGGDGYDDGGGYDGGGYDDGGDGGW